MVGDRQRLLLDGYTYSSSLGVQCVEFRVSNDGTTCQVYAPAEALQASQGDHVSCSQSVRKANVHVHYLNSVCVLSVLLYGSECWTPLRRHLQKSITGVSRQCLASLMSSSGGSRLHLRQCESSGDTLKLIGKAASGVAVTSC